MLESFRKLSPTVLACMGGLAATVFDVALLVSLIHLGVPVAIAAGLGALLGAFTGFASNKYVAFRDRSPLSVRQVGAFGLVAVGTALLMAAAMQITVVGLGVPYLAAKAVCATILFFVWSLPAQKKFVFSMPGPVERDPSHSFA